MLGAPEMILSTQLRPTYIMEKTLNRTSLKSLRLKKKLLDQFTFAYLATLAENFWTLNVEFVLAETVCNANTANVYD